MYVVTYCKYCAYFDVLHAESGTLTTYIEPRYKSSVYT